MSGTTLIRIRKSDKLRLKEIGFNMEQDAKKYYNKRIRMTSPKVLHVILSKETKESPIRVNIKKIIEVARGKGR